MDIFKRKLRTPVLNSYFSFSQNYNYGLIFHLEFQMWHIDRTEILLEISISNKNYYKVSLENI